MSNTPVGKPVPLGVRIGVKLGRPKGRVWGASQDDVAKIRSGRANGKWPAGSAKKG